MKYTATYTGSGEFIKRADELSALVTYACHRAVGDYCGPWRNIGRTATYITIKDEDGLLVGHASTKGSFSYAPYYGINRTSKKQSKIVLKRSLVAALTITVLSIAIVALTLN